MSGILDRHSTFAVTSIALVNVGKSAGARTNLIVENSLLETLEKPEHIFIACGVVGRLLQRQLLRQLLLDSLELAGRKLAPRMVGE